MTFRKEVPVEEKHPLKSETLKPPNSGADIDLSSLLVERRILGKYVQLSCELWNQEKNGLSIPPRGILCTHNSNATKLSDFKLRTELCFSEE